MIPARLVRPTPGKWEAAADSYVRLLARAYASAMVSVAIGYVAVYGERGRSDFPAWKCGQEMQEAAMGAAAIAIIPQAS